jgi:hypothetical protein
MGTVIVYRFIRENKKELLRVYISEAVLRLRSGIAAWIVEVR